MRLLIRSSKDAYTFILSALIITKRIPLSSSKYLLLNQAHNALRIYESSSGGIKGIDTYIRLISSAAPKTNATSHIMIHNHPSGNLTASESYKQITRKEKEAGRILDIILPDSLIITTKSLILLFLY